MTQQPMPQPADPFGETARPSVSFKDTPVGTSYTLEVIEAPTMAQSRVYETGDLAYWPDGNPKMAAVTGVVDTTTGEEKALWASKPSALFAAIAAAQRTAGQQIAVGGRLVVTYTADKVNPEKPRLNPQKLYDVQYTPPATGGAFGEAPQQMAQQPQAAPQQPAAQPVAPVPMPTVPAPQAAPQQVQQAAPPAAPAAAAQPTAEQVASVRAAGLDPATVFPGYTG